MRWRLPLLAGLLACGAAGCGSSVVDGDKKPADTKCVPTDKFFSQQVWQAFMGQQCYACHNAQGTARGSDLVLQPSSVPDYLRINLETVQRVARVEIDGTSLLLLKPTASVDHEGGLQIEKGDERYRALEELVQRFDEPVSCSDAGGDEGLAGLELLDPRATLRKASLSLVARLPTADEEAKVETGGEEALPAILGDMMREEAFYERLKEGWNDLLLTDRYVPGSRAIDLLDATDYPSRTWYQPPEGTEGVDPNEVGRLRGLANRAVAREALELIAHVVRENRPFTEVLTADYRLVNPFSAKTYGLDLGFADPNDPNEWKEAKVPGMEHAGVLTSHMFLNRFPTTDTNRNRNRARMVYRFFLATDILKLAERPVDPTTIEGHNPTMNNPECTVCHGPMDPVAGTFMNWDARGRYRPPAEGWYADMRPPGFGDAVVPNDERGASLRWLGQTIAKDPLFVTAVVQNTWTMLTGQAPLAAPQDPTAPGAAAEQEAYEAQNAFFTKVGEDFVADGYDLRTVFTRLIVGPYYRAADVAETAADPEALAQLGAGRLLTPEMLDRKIEAVLGYPWSPNATSAHYLQDDGNYRIFYGGIDSDQITERIRAPNGVMSNVASRMANEMACRAVPRDFVLDAADRLLFPAIETSYEPEDENGFAIPGAADAIRENLVHLHERVLGERLYVGHPEIERTYQLFYDTWKEGKAGIAAGTIDEWITWNCRARTDFWTGEELPEADRIERDAHYTTRAWMAVLTYLLLDYRFLYE